MSLTRRAAAFLSLCPAICGLVISTAAAQPLPAAMPSPGHNGSRMLLRAVASIRVFGNINRNDARASLKVWMDLVALGKGFDVDTSVDILDSVPEIRQRLESRSAELASLCIWDFFELESSHLLTPVLTDARDAAATAYSYILLVNPSSRITTPAGLRGKNVLLSARGSGATGTAWLEVLLAKEGLGRTAAFLASAKPVPKPSACVLPVFFGTADACIVDEPDFNLTKEMNPQLGRLRIVTRSRPLIESVIAVPLDGRPLQREMIDWMLTLGETTRGRQVLTVFQTDRLVRLQPGDLDSARELWQDYSRIAASAPRPANPAMTAAHEGGDR
ncbi:MAG TPA: PhnD/SsuA/transferrin family substrate-binding protein [Verrucomicrobiae bacterium]|nr:PhnD/SsuA/transferrin family substrate-binding protein [Verrucomicrobiae bacterium]